jgi:hypothetical protein
MDLRTNLLTGQLPDGLFSLDALVELRIGNNPNLESGTLPDMFASLTDLELM